MRRTISILVLVTVVMSAGCLSFGSDADTDPVKDTKDDFVRTELPYTEVKQLQTAEGEAAFIGSNASGDYLVHGDDVVASADRIGQYAHRNGRWAYTVGRQSNDNWQWSVRYDDYTGPWVDAVGPVTPVSNAWAYTAKANDSVTLYYKGSSVGLKYDMVMQAPVEVAESLAYHAVTRAGNSVLVNDGTELKRGTDIGNVFTNVDGKLTYSRHDEADDGGTTVTLVRGRRWIETAYPAVHSVVRANNTVAYAATDKSGNTYVVHGDEKYGPFDGVKTLETYDDRLLFVVRTGQGNRIWYDGTWISKTYPMIDAASIVRPESTFAFKMYRDEGAENARIVYDGEQLDLADGSAQLAVRDGKLLVLAEGAGSTYLLEER